METRARRQSKRSLPPELWCIVLSHLPPQEAVRAASVSHEFATISRAASVKACERLFPQHKHRIAKLISGKKLAVQKVLNLIHQHENEAAAHPDVYKGHQVQKLVLPEHRQIAVEWLIEVAWDWQLESTVVYRGAQYLDHYLAAVPVQALSKFQMLAISTLRTALKHSTKLAERERAKLPYKHWAEVTDGACTEAEVRTTCNRLERLVQQKHRDHPNAKQRLRYLWYRLYEAAVVRQEHVYVYMLASFLLHLSILDSSLSAITPTLLATAALSLSLEVFRFCPWPAVLQEHSLYLPEDLQQPQELLRRTQEELPAEQLRNLWVHSYSYIGTNPLQQPAYSHLQMIVKQRGPIKQLDVILRGVANSSGSRAAVNPIAGHRAAAGFRGARLPAGIAAAGDNLLAPADGTVVVGVVPAAAARLPMQQLPRVDRVTTRAAAAAGHQQLQQRRQQQQPPALLLLGSVTAAGSSSRANPSVPSSSNQQLQQSAFNDRSLPTPQRVSLAPMSPGAGEHVAVRVGPAAAGAASLMAGLAGGSSFQPANAGATTTPVGAPVAATHGPATRRATRELPARRAVTCSRYGCRSSGTSAAAEAAGLSQAAGPEDEDKGLAATGTVSAAADRFSFAGGMLLSATGGIGRSSPKQTTTGHRGLVALFNDASNAAGGVRTRGAELMLQTQRLGSVEMERIAEGTPHPPQLMQLPADMQNYMMDAAAGRLASAVKGLTTAAASDD